jgi:hypothetical protein
VAANVVLILSATRWRSRYNSWPPIFVRNGVSNHAPTLMTPENFSKRPTPVDGHVPSIGPKITDDSQCCLQGLLQGAPAPVNLL